MNLHKKLLEIEVEIIIFTNSPTDTPSIDRLAEDIEKKITFLKKLITAETASHDPKSDELSEIDRRLEELEAEFNQSNSDSHSVIVHEGDDSEHSSGSLCNSCSERMDAGNEKWKVYENTAMFYEPSISPPPPPSDVFYKSVVPPSEMRSDLEDAEEMSCCDCDQIEQTVGCKERGRRWRWRMLVVVMTVVSVVSTVSFSVYINSDEREGFLTPT